MTGNRIWTFVFLNVVHSAQVGGTAPPPTARPPEQQVQTQRGATPACPPSAGTGRGPLLPRAT